MNLDIFLETQDPMRVLITGLSGTGKSTLAATLARRYRLIWINTENAASVFRKLPVEWRHNVNLINIPDSAAFPVAAQTVQKLFKDKKANICHQHGIIDCAICKKSGAPSDYIDFTSLDNRRDVVVLDSLTQTGNSFLAYVMRASAIDAKPERDDWGGLRKHTEFLSSSIQAATYNIICTATTIEAELEDGRKKLVPAFGSAGSSAGIAAKFSTVIYCDVKNNKHVAYSSSTASNTVLTKSREGFRIEDGELDLCRLFDTIPNSSQDISPTIVQAAVADPIQKTVEVQKAVASSKLNSILASSSQAKK